MSVLAVVRNVKGNTYVKTKGHEDNFSALYNGMTQHIGKTIKVYPLCSEWWRGCEPIGFNWHESWLKFVKTKKKSTAGAAFNREEGMDQ